MQVRTLVAAGALALAALIAQPASAQDCAGFTDVAAASPFCPSVEWMRNRAVTTGCGANVYCPNDPVSRLAMSAFMQRLGVALTPTFQRKRDTGLGALNFAGQQNLCATDPVAISNYPRTAIVRGLVNLYTPNGGMDVKAWIVYSTNGGTSWITPGSNDGNAYGALYSGLTPPNDISLNPMNVIDLDVGTTYQFALAAIRTNATGGDVANVYCENLVQLVNRNGTTSPLDAAADPGPHGRAD